MSYHRLTMQILKYFQQSIWLIYIRPFICVPTKNVSKKWSFLSVSANLPEFYGLSLIFKQLLPLAGNCLPLITLFVLFFKIYIMKCHLSRNRTHEFPVLPVMISLKSDISYTTNITNPHLQSCLKP